MKIAPTELAPPVETLQTVLGGPHRQRTPIHLNTPPPGYPEEVIREGDEVDTFSASDFNAIGSLVMSEASSMHLPIIDIHPGGGAKLQAEDGEVVSGNRVLIRHAYESSAPRYTSDSFLREVLDRNGISLEVHEYRNKPGRDTYVHSDFLDLVLRSEESDVFDVASSALLEGGFRRYLYIQREFSSADNWALVSELGKLGVVGKQWQNVVAKHHMGIVYTPWTHENIGSSRA